MPEMNDIAGTPGLIVCVGLAGRIEVSTNARTWQRFPSGLPPRELTGAWVHSPSLAYVVGARGLILRWDGRGFVPVPGGTTSDLFSVWGSGPEDVWFGGAGVLLHLEGGELRRHEVEHWVTRIWGSGQGDVWFLGPGRRCLRWQEGQLCPGTIAAREERDREAALYDITGTGPEDVWAVGAAGTILRWDGRRWERVPSATRSVLYGVCVGPGGDIWVTTGMGQLRRMLDRKTWTIAADLATLAGWLDGICAVGDTIWFCGKKGIFHHDIRR